MHLWQFPYRTPGALCALLLCLTSAGGLRAPAAAAAPAGSAQVREAPAAAPPVPELIKRTAALRELAFTEPVAWELLAPATMRAQFLDSQLDAEQLRLTEKVLKKFGLIPDDLDLLATLRALLGEQVAGYYDPEAKKLFSLNATTPMAEAVGGPLAELEVNHTLVHELTHALQDQHFDLQALLDEDAVERGDILDDAIAAHLAVAEGDATMVGFDYLFQAMTPGNVPVTSLTVPPQMLEQLMEQAPQADVPGADEFNKAPPYIRRSLFFPYSAGFQFVAALRRRGGWALVDRAFTDPPESTEQVLHVERYLTNRDRPTRLPVPALDDVLGDAWRPERAANLGELDVRLLTEVYLGREKALSVSAGWDGDIVRLYTNAKDGRVLAIWSSIWDTPEDAAEFAQAYAEILTQRYGEPARADGAWTWRTPAGEVSLERRGYGALVIDALPPALRASVAARVWETLADVSPTP